MSSDKTSPPLPPMDGQACNMEDMPEFSTNIVWHHASVTRERREMQNCHRGAIIWFTVRLRVRPLKK